MQNWPTPCLYVVATPIGNLGDLSPRALEVLTNADVILCEDTRHTRQLLTHFGIQKKNLESYQDFAEERKAASVVDRIISQKMMAVLVSDAGTPCIADPGYRLIDKARDEGLTIHPIPGPSALAALVSVSGLPCERFSFVGFLPTKSKALRDEIQTWQGSVIFYESMRRLSKTLEAIAELHPSARLVIGREMTKLHEEILRFDVAVAKQWIDLQTIARGEVAVMIAVGDRVAAAEEDTAEKLQKAVQKAVKEGATIKDLIKKFGHLGVSRSELYGLMLEAKGKNNTR